MEGRARGQSTPRRNHAHRHMTHLTQHGQTEAETSLEYRREMAEVVLTTPLHTIASYPEAAEREQNAPSQIMLLWH